MKTFITVLFIGLCFFSCNRTNPVDVNTDPDDAGTIRPAIRLSKDLAVSDVDSIIAIVTGDNIDGSLFFPLAWEPASRRFSGAIDVPEEGNTWTVTIVLFDAQGRKIGQGSKPLDRATTSLVMDTILCTSALPAISAFAGVVAAVNDTIRLQATVRDSFGGTVTYEWQIGSAAFTPASGPDTAFAWPVSQESLLCVLRVTDDDGNVVMDTAVVIVISEKVPAGMKYIPGGSFLMGYQGSWQEQPVHQVTLSSFLMDTIEVTQGHFSALLPQALPGNNLPANDISWFDAVLFCNARSVRDSLDTVYAYSGFTGTPGNGCDDLTNLTMDSSKHGYRLPTDAEWEYACRGGTTTPYFWGSDSFDAPLYAWYDLTIHPGAQKRPNGFGLYDMIGNVSEWCQDLFATYPAYSETNPWGPSTGTGWRVMRGYHVEYVKIDNQWVGIAPLWRLRTTIRGNPYPDITDPLSGFRCVLPVR